VVSDTCIDGEFAKYIANKLNTKNGSSCTYIDTLPMIIDRLVNNYVAERKRINTSSQFVHDLGLQ